MMSFSDYWKEKSAKRRQSWVSKAKRFANQHTQLEDIRKEVYLPLDYGVNFSFEDYKSGHFIKRNPIVCWRDMNFCFSEDGLRAALEDEGADIILFWMEMAHQNIKGLEAPQPENKWEIRFYKPNKVYDYDKMYRSWQHGISSPSVFDVYGGKGRGGFTFKKKLDCYNRGLITFEDLRQTNIGAIQNMQIEAALTGKEFINPDGIRKFLEKLTYPLYFLDFETMQQPVPQYDGQRPYQQITFQYSLHIKAASKREQSDTSIGSAEREQARPEVKPSATADYEHREFLAPSDGSDPRRSLAEQLCKDIPMNVCTLAYNKDFECGRIKELASLYPDLAVHLLNICDHIQDLLTPFQSSFYYVPAMGGSFSIKSVLPAFFPNEPTLNYHNLDLRCQNGGDAMTIFPRIQFMEPEEAEASREALLRYCELDTWAMVKVWEKLKEVAGVN